MAARLPARVLEHVFSYLELSDLMRCALVCWHWNHIVADENSEVWRSLCSRSLSEEALRSDILCNLPTYKGKVGPPAAAHFVNGRVGSGGSLLAVCPVIPHRNGSRKRSGEG